MPESDPDETVVWRAGRPIATVFRWPRQGWMAALHKAEPNTFCRITGVGPTADAAVAAALAADRWPEEPWEDWP